MNPRYHLCSNPSAATLPATDIGQTNLLATLAVLVAILLLALPAALAFG